MKPDRFIPAPPISPGGVLRKFILSNELTQEQLADAMRVSRFSINQLINGKRNVTAEMALKLARATSTSPEFWLDLQQGIDVYKARLELSDLLPTIPVLRRPKTDAELFSYATPHDEHE